MPRKTKKRKTRKRKKGGGFKDTARKYAPWVVGLMSAAAYAEYNKQFDDSIVKGEIRSPFPHRAKQISRRESHKALSGHYD